MTQCLLVRHSPYCAKSLVYNNFPRNTGPSMAPRHRIEVSRLYVTENNQLSSRSSDHSAIIVVSTKGAGRGIKL